MTKEQLIRVAQEFDTERLKTIQRYQRSRLIHYKRNHRFSEQIPFLQVRVDAVAEVLAARKKAAA